MRDGNVRGLRIEESSGVPTLDRSALRAVSDATPLPALPAMLHEPYLPASFVFRLYPEGY
jgi:TonB family protein